MMTLKSTLILSTCLLAVIGSIARVQASSSLEDLSAPDSNIERPGRVRKRSYQTWMGMPNRRNSVSVFEASAVWKPQTYTISRPYYIPVFGASGQRPIFYPPQPFYLNPGAPLDNPPKPPYQGPMYVPPKEGTTTRKPGGLGSRFGEDDDDAPIWGGSVGAPMVQMPLNGGEKESGPVPTRTPIFSRPTSPPLMHEVAPNLPSDQESTGLEDSRPARPPQSIQRPPTLRTTTVRPSSTTTLGPSNCVWAIISCCSAADPKAVPQNCFEQRGCPGPFWGASPCESDYARTAIAAAVNYYNQNPGARLGK